MRHLVYGTITALLLAVPALAQSSQSGASDKEAAKSQVQDKTETRTGSAAQAKKDGDGKIVEVPKVAPDPPLGVDDITGNSARNAMGGGPM
jgi:hypothetical protein